jgi:hypothetical protein
MPLARPVVVGAGEPADLQLAAVAGAGVDLADVERPREAPPDLLADLGAQRLDAGRRRRRLGDDARPEHDRELPEHQRDLGSRTVWRWGRPFTGSFLYKPAAYNPHFRFER